MDDDDDDAILDSLLIGRKSGRESDGPRRGPVAYLEGGPGGPRPTLRSSPTSSFTVFSFFLKKLTIFSASQLAKKILFALDHPNIDI